jgi:undecaprenyl diphosphate synthase
MMHEGAAIIEWWYIKMDQNLLEQEMLQQIDMGKIPGHVAVIMDGNGRWARERGLPRSAGHKQGVETVRLIVRFSNQLGFKALTLFAFSTENWRRPPWEVNYLMSLPEQYLHTELPELVKNNVRVNFIGDPERLPQQVCKAIEKGLQATRTNTGMMLNFAMNYGARAEIVQAVRQLAEAVLDGKISKNIHEEQISEYLYTGKLHIPDPDLLIRTSGEYRISNFLLWQLAYSELWFTPVYWPDFNRLHLLQAVYDYQMRERRFGSA